MIRPELDQVINATCPWSGKPVREDSLAFYRSNVVGFCNPACRDKFVRAIARFDGALEALAGKAGMGD